MKFSGQGKLYLIGPLFFETFSELNEMSSTVTDEDFKANLWFYLSPASLSFPLPPIYLVVVLKLTKADSPQLTLSLVILATP